MNFSRMFTTTQYKGKQNYIHTQKYYEFFRTVLYFGISFTVFVVGYMTTGDRLNILTVVAILGCLPASKSIIGMFMFMRYKSLEEESANKIKYQSNGLDGAFDMIFTSYEKNYIISHLTVTDNSICGYSCTDNFNESEFQKHLDGILKATNYRDVTIKIFTDLNKYLDRLEQLKKLDRKKDNTDLLNTLKEVVL